MFVGKVSLEQIKKHFDISKIKLNNAHDFNHVKVDRRHHPYELEKRLKNCLISGNIEALQAVISDFSTYEDSSIGNGDSIRSLKNNLICSCTLTTRVLIDAGVEEDYAYFLSDLYINKIESLYEVQSLVTLNGVMLLDFMEQIKDQMLLKENIHSDSIKKIVDYMNRNIYTPITLSSVAEEFHMNISYLSRLFKKEVGRSFNQHLHICRIKKAKHMLLGEISLVEISQRLCYTSQSHFTSTFKRICGITPNKYRQKCNNGNE